MERPARQPAEILEPSLEIADFIKLHALSTREGEILRLLLSRVTTAEEIGRVLSISPHTVNNHLQKLFEKTVTTNKTEVVANFVKHVIARLNHCKMFVKQPKVMVIDDEGDMCELIREYLVHKGMKVYPFTDPAEALAAIPELRLDFIVSDIDMPGMNGLTLLTEVRRIHRHLPMMIFITGKPAYTIEKSLALGAVAFLEKPLQMERLFFTVMEHFVESTAERSRLLRVDASLQTTVNKIHRFTSSNIGFGGVFLPFSDVVKRLSPKLKIGNSVELLFSLGDSTAPIRAEGEIVWRRELPALGVEPGIGVKFTAMDDDGREALEEFVRFHKITSFIPLGEIFGTPTPPQTPPTSNA